MPRWRFWSVGLLPSCAAASIAITSTPFNGTDSPYNFGQPNQDDSALNTPYVSGPGFSVSMVAGQAYDLGAFTSDGLHLLVDSNDELSFTLTDPATAIGFNYSSDSASLATSNISLSNGDSDSTPVDFTYDYAGHDLGGFFGLGRHPSRPSR